MQRVEASKWINGNRSLKLEALKVKWQGLKKITYKKYVKECNRVNAQDYWYRHNVIRYMNERGPPYYTFDHVSLAESTLGIDDMMQGEQMDAMFRR